MQHCDYLHTLGIAYVENNQLVRGLDYYNQTVFEFWKDQIHRAQGRRGWRRRVPF